MQQPNFTLLDLVFQEQPINENKTSIKETAKFVSYNQLGISLFFEANCTSNTIEKPLFSSILKLIEDKLYELEERLDNREQVKNIEQQLHLLKPDHYFRAKQHDDSQSEHINQRKYSQQSEIEIVSPQTAQIQDQKSQKSQKSQRSKSQIGKSNTEMSQDQKPKYSESGFVQKLDQFDKKIHQMQEQVNKLSVKDDQFQRKIEQQVSQQLKDSQERLIQNEKLFKQVSSINQEISDNQKGFLSYITQMRQELDYFQQELNKIQEDGKLPLMRFEQTLNEISKQVGIHENEIELQKTIIESLDSDMLILLKKFKDILTEIANKKIKSKQSSYQFLK